jgi:hypothetical protein
MYKSQFKENIDKRYKNRMDIVIKDIAIGGFNGKVVNETYSLSSKQNQMTIDFKNQKDSNNAYEKLKDIKSLGITQEGKRIWVSWN